MSSNTTEGSGQLPKWLRKPGESTIFSFRGEEGQELLEMKCYLWYLSRI